MFFNCEILCVSNVLYRYGVDSSYSFLMSEVECFTSGFLVILQCSYSPSTESCERNSDELSVICCESFSSYFMCLWYSCMVMELKNILFHACFGSIPNVSQFIGWSWCVIFNTSMNDLHLPFKKHFQQKVIYVHVGNFTKKLRLQYH